MPPLEAPHGPAKKKVRRARPDTSSTLPHGGAGSQHRSAPAKPKPAPAYHPTKSQTRSSRAQEHGYRSEGKAVRKVAGRQQTTARAKSTERGYKSQGKQVEKRANRQRLESAFIRTYPSANRDYVAKAPDKELRFGVRHNLHSTKLEATGVRAPVLKALALTTRPLHAVAAATRRDISELKKGHIHLTHDTGALKAAKRGIENKDKSTFSDVAKDLGIKNKVVRAVVGTTGDVVLDPTTYITGGAGSIAEKEAARATESTAAKSTVRQAETGAAKRAAAEGDRAVQKAAARAKAKGKTLSEGHAAQIRREAEARHTAKPVHAEAAAKRARSKNAHKGSGLIIRAGRHEVPGVRKATAAASRPVKKVVRKATPERVRHAGKSIAADVNPNVVPEGVSRAEHEAVTSATRSARAKTNRGIQIAQDQAVAIQREIGEKNYQRVIDALESGDLKSLPADLRKVAVRVRSHFRYANRLRKQAGIRGGERKNYVPHQLTEEAKAAKGETHRGSGTKTIRPSYEKARKEQRSLKQLREEEPGKYSEDLARLYGERVAAGHADVAKAELNRRLARMGETITRSKVEHGMQIPNPAKSDLGVYHILGSNIREVTDKDELQRLADTGFGKTKDNSGRYVILNKEVVKRATEGVAPHLKSAYGIGRALDKTTAGFKRIAIATPGFHVRNFAGDTQLHYLGVPGHSIPKNFVQGGRVLKAITRAEKADRRFEKPAASGKTLKTGRYGHVSYEEVARRLVEAGAARSGYISRELPELAKSGAEGSLKIRRVGFPRAVKQFGRNREDLPRLASAVYALRHGATWEEAAQKVADVHFDYGHLTAFERNVARRLIPFYTFSARNIPLQARKFVTHPGKYANYEKIREEAAKATGTDQQSADTKFLYGELRKAGVKLPNGWEQQLSEWEQRNAGVPVSVGGHKFTVSLGLPLQDLSEFPGMAGSNQAREYYDKFMSLINPIVKDPVEFGANFSFFFRDQIENDHSPLVSAPGWVSALPPAAKKELGIVRIVDKKTGKKVWGWPGKTDYIAKALPGSPSYIQQLSAGGTDRRGRNVGGKLLAFLGVKSVPVDPVKNAVSLAYQRGQDISKRLSALNEQDINAKHPNATYNTLKRQQATLDAVIEGTTNGINVRLIKVDNRLADVKAKLAKTKRGNIYYSDSSGDHGYYTAQYENLLDQKKILSKQRDALLGKKPIKTVRLSRRPLTLRQKLDQQRSELRSGDLRQKLERDAARERARTRIISGGG